MSFISNQIVLHHFAKLVESVHIGSVRVIYEVLFGMFMLYVRIRNLFTQRKED